MVDERDIGLAETWAGLVRTAEDHLSEVLFHPALEQLLDSAEADHAVSQEAARLRNIMLFEENQDVSDSELTQCNRKGERVMPTQRCAAPNAKGDQCGRLTRRGCYCFTHMRSLLGLQIKDSQNPLAGKGLFTAVARKKGEEVARYTGDRLRGSPDPDFKGSLYVAQLDEATFIDAARTNAGIATLLLRCCQLLLRCCQLLLRSC